MVDREVLVNSFLTCSIMVPLVFGETVRVKLGKEGLYRMVGKWSTPIRQRCLKTLVDHKYSEGTCVHGG